jgi:choice-of-anchor C domain-containing protein
VTFFLTAAQAQTGLMNGSFENGTNPGDATVLSPGNTAVASWTVVGGDVTYVGGRWQPSQGARSIGLPCGGGISQTFDTEPNRSYEVRFNIAGDPGTSPALKSVVMTFGANSRVFTFDTTGHSLRDMGWEARSWIFPATDPTTTLTLASPATECSTAAVDNVRLVEVEVGVRANPRGTAPVPFRIQNSEVRTTKDFSE